MSLFKERNRLHLPCFVTTTPISVNKQSWHDSSKERIKRPSIVSVRCNQDRSAVPNTPGVLLRSWANSRTISSTADLSRRFISVLLISNKCQRAAIAEKALSKLAQDYSISRRLLILSAGIDSRPGDPLPRRVVSAAKDREMDLADERPCASFDISDLDYYDFVVVVDRLVRDRLMKMAEAYAHVSGGHLYEWERKIRLLCDFDCALSEAPRSAGMPLDVPPIDSVGEVRTIIDITENGCERLIRSLITAGL